MFEKHQQKSLKEVQATSKNSFHCKTPDCEGWCFISDNINSFKCPICKRLNCITCQVNSIIIFINEVAIVYFYSNIMDGKSLKRIYNISICHTTLTRIFEFWSDYNKRIQRGNLNFSIG